MTGAEILAFIVGIVKAIPIIDSWFQQLITAYVNGQIDSMEQENRDAIRIAVKDHDQRALERAIGNPNPGSHSGAIGTEIRQTLPGVKNEK